MFCSLIKKENITEKESRKIPKPDHARTVQLVQVGRL